MAKVSELNSPFSMMPLGTEPQAVSLSASEGFSSFDSWAMVGDSESEELVKALDSMKDEPQVVLRGRKEAIAHLRNLISD